MNAPALNTATTATTGAPGHGANAATPGLAAGDALAGFEALLVALFPQGPTPDAAATRTAAPGNKTAEAPDAVDETLPVDPAALPTDNAAAGDANAALLASVIVAQPTPGAAAPVSTKSAPGSTDAPPAWGRGKAPGLPAAPALAHRASPQDQTAEAAQDAPTEESPFATAEASTPSQRPAKDAGAPLPSRAAAPPQPPAPQTPAPAVTATDAKAEIPEATPSAPIAVPTAAETTDAPSAPVVASLATPPEPAPVRASRAERAERAKGPSARDGAKASDSPPVATSVATSVDTPVHAKAAASAGKPAAAQPEAAELAGGEAEHAQDSPDGVAQAETRASAQTLPPAQHATHAVRGSPETVANLAAQIIKKLEGKSTRFDLELNPGGLGKVDVRLEIGAHGRITAAMTFDNPQAAADVKARSAELQQALEQAGFDLGGRMSFDVAGDRGQQQRQAWQDQNDNKGAGFRGEAFRAALDTAGDAADAAVNGALRLRRGVSAGLDLRI